MKDFKDVEKLLEKAEELMSDAKRNIGTQYLNGVIATLRWILFNKEQPID